MSESSTNISRDESSSSIGSSLSTTSSIASAKSELWDVEKTRSRKKYVQSRQRSPSVGNVKSQPKKQSVESRNNRNPSIDHSKKGSIDSRRSSAERPQRPSVESRKSNAPYNDKKPSKNDRQGSNDTNGNNNYLHQHQHQPQQHYGSFQAGPQPPQRYSYYPPHQQPYYQVQDPYNNYTYGSMAYPVPEPYPRESQSTLGSFADYARTSYASTAKASMIPQEEPRYSLAPPPQEKKKKEKPGKCAPVIMVFRCIALIIGAGVIAVGYYGIYSSIAYKAIEMERERCYHHRESKPDSPGWITKYTCFQIMCIIAFALGLISLLAYCCCRCHNCYRNAWIFDLIAQLLIALLIGAAGGVLIWGVMEVVGEADKKVELYCPYNPRIENITTEQQLEYAPRNRTKRSYDFNELEDGLENNTTKNEVNTISMDEREIETKSGTENGTASSAQAERKKGTFDQIRPLVQFEILMSAGGLAVLNAIVIIIIMIMICVGHPTGLEGDEEKKDEIIKTAPPPMEKKPIAMYAPKQSLGYKMPSASALYGF